MPGTVGHTPGVGLAGVGAVNEGAALVDWAGSGGEAGAPELPCPAAVVLAGAAHAPSSGTAPSARSSRRPIGLDSRVTHARIVGDLRNDANSAMLERLMVGHQCSRCTTSSKGRRSGCSIGLSGRSAG